jgi:LPS O-antigen subunit length determinant protein (WzzB/FepE family)
MNDKEIPLSSTPYQVGNFKHKPEDEISLLDLMEVLFRKKVLIFFTASIIIALSIFYAFSTKNTYRATIGFQPPEKSLTFFYPEMYHEILPNISQSLEGALVIKKNYMLNKFIAELQSYSNQEKVFIEGKFHERFVVKNPKIDIKKGIVQEIYRSIHARDVEGLSAKVVDFEMKGVNPEVASDFLNALADWVKSKIELDLQESIQKGAKAQLAVHSAQLDLMIIKEQREYEDKIGVLTDNIKIAKKLGILGNNFVHFKPDGSIFDVLTFNNISSGNTDTISRKRIKGKNEITWPIWYIYGQRALEQELNLFERRGVSGQYTKKTNDLIFKIESLSKTDLSKINFEPVIISQPSIPPVDQINVKKMQVILSGIAFGLLIGILMALLSLVMTQLKKRMKLSPLN